MDRFDLLRDGTRREILLAVAEAHREAPADPWLSFSALRERVGARDSSNFNYHLKKLTDRYVTAEDGAYRATLLGLRVVASLREVTGDEPPIEFDTDTDCFCGASLHLRHAEGVVTWDCGEGHEHRLLLPDAVRADRTPEQLRSLAATLAYDWHQQVADGCCPLCYGAIAPTFERMPEDPIDPMLGATCDGCGIHPTVPVGTAALGHPTTRSFYGDHGVDPRSRSPWALELLTADPDLADGVATVSTTIDGESLSVAVASDGTVVAVERTE